MKISQNLLILNGNFLQFTNSEKIVNLRCEIMRF